MKTTKAIQFTAQLKASAKGEYPKEIEVFHTGSWRTGWHGDFDVTEADLDEAIAHFNAGVYRVNGTEPLPGTLDHLGGDSPAAFRMTDFRRNGDRLIATVEWTELGKEKLDRDEYRYISIEFYPSSMPFENPEVEGEILKNVVTGATLTNDPLLKKLKPVLASARSGASDKDNHKGGDMELEELRVKKLEDLTDEEKAFLSEHKEELNDEERKTFQLVEDGDDNSADDDDAAGDDDQGDDSTDDDDQSDGLKASAAYKSLEAKVKKLEADAKAGREASLKLARKEAEDFVAASVAKGRIKSDHSDDAVELLLASAGDQRTRLEKFISDLPENELLAGEHGTGAADEDASAIDRVFASAKELVDKGEAKTIGEATRTVLKADAGLKKQFEAEQKGNK